MSAKDGLMGRLMGNADKFSDKQLQETVHMMVDHGMKRGASDIHVEPHERFVLVRYRIDGALRGVHKLPRPALAGMMATLKKLADLNVQETQAPQEGSFDQTGSGHTVQVRVTTMPVYGGEKAVLHLTMQLGKPQGLEALGFWGEGLQVLNQILASPHGLVAVAGPRHSGIGSTLFGMLDQLNSPMVGIATVETHVRHRLAGVNQTYIANNSMTVLEGLQAALKQDPNIIMISDTPDSHTAALAVQAATKGHLVLAGMHTSSSITAAARLHTGGSEPFLLVTALRAAVGQRLVRKLCPDCRVRVTLSDEQRKELEQSFGIATPAARKRVHELESALAPVIFGDVKQLSSTPQRITHLWGPGSAGCDTCEHSGYQGRTAITEILQSTPRVQKLLLSREIVPAAELQAAAVKDGFIPMALDGLVKALRGQTTIAEVLRSVHSAA